MATMFSMPVIDTEVSRFFIEDSEEVEGSPEDDELHSKTLEQLKIRKNEQKAAKKEELQEQLKAGILKYNTMANRKLTLN